MKLIYIKVDLYAKRVIVVVFVSYICKNMGKSNGPVEFHKLIDACMVEL